MGLSPHARRDARRRDWDDYQICFKDSIEVIRDVCLQYWWTDLHWKHISQMWDHLYGVKKWTITTSTNLQNHKHKSQGQIKALGHDQAVGWVPGTAVPARLQLDDSGHEDNQRNDRLRPRQNLQMALWPQKMGRKSHDQKYRAKSHFKRQMIQLSATSLSTEFAEFWLSQNKYNLFIHW